MKILGIDLAGRSTNPTGICIFDNGKIFFKTAHSDEEILQTCFGLNPDVIGIDAPVMYGRIKVRKADKVLKKYGALPPTLPSMRCLTIRGSKLAAELSSRYKVIEVFPTATAKILGVYNKDYRETARLLGVDVVNKHELDAYLCCITAKMFIEGETVTVGDDEGRIVVPELEG